MNDEDEVKRDYTVLVDVFSTHEFRVDQVNSPEEAESIVEEWLEQGENGEISDKEVFSMDSFPVEKEEDFN